MCDTVRSVESNHSASRALASVGEITAQLLKCLSSFQCSVKTGAAAGRSECAQTPVEHSSGKNKILSNKVQVQHYSSCSPEGLGTVQNKEKNRIKFFKNPNLQKRKLVRISALGVQAHFIISTDVQRLAARVLEFPFKARCWRKHLLLQSFVNRNT